MPSMQELLLGGEFQVKLATDVEGAKVMVREYINSDPELQRKYGRTYDDILSDNKKFSAWANRVTQMYQTQTVKEKVGHRLIQPGATEVPAVPTPAAPEPQAAPLKPMPSALQLPEERQLEIGGQQAVMGGGTKTAAAKESLMVMSPKAIRDREEEMFKYLVATGAFKIGVPSDAVADMGNLLAGGIDPSSSPEEITQQINFHVGLQRKMFEPQVFFPAMGYVLFGNWPSLLTIMAAGGLGSIYQDMVNTGRIPNVLPPFDQPALGGQKIGGALNEQVTPENWQQFVANAGENAALQGLWELGGIIVGGLGGGISKTRSGLLGKEALIKRYEDVIKYAERLGIKFPGAYLNAEGYGRMIWDFSHATITSEPLYNKWVADLVEKIGKEATEDLFKTFKSGLVDNVTQLMNPREIGMVVGDALQSSKVFSDLYENFLWRRLSELDRYGVKVDMSQALATLNQHADRVLADLAPDEQEMVEKVLQGIRQRIEGFTTRGEVVGRQLGPRDYVTDEFPLQLTFKDSDRLRKAFRRYGRRTDNGSVQALIGEVTDDIDRAMMEAAGRVSPEARSIIEDMRAFTQRKHDILDKELIQDIMSMHGGKRDLWAGIADSIQTAAKTGRGPDMMKQLDEAMNFYIENRRKWVSKEYQIPEEMVDVVVERWKTDYFDDLRQPYLGEKGPMTAEEARVAASKEAPEYVRYGKAKRELGFKGTDVDEIIRRIRKDMTRAEFNNLLFATKDDILNTVRASTLNDIMGRVEEVGEVTASGGGVWRKMINKLRDVPTERESRQVVRELLGFNPVQLNAEIFHGPATQQATYKALFTKQQLEAIRDITHHLAVITGGGLKYKSNVMVVKLVQAGVLATIAVKTVNVTDEDQSYNWKDASSAGLILLAPWVLTKVMLRPAWAKWFVKGFTGGVVSREALTNISRLSMALWSEEGLPLFIGAGMAEEQADKVGGAITRGLSAESAVNQLPARKP